MLNELSAGDLLDEFSQVCSKLNVHRRAASNISEQLHMLRRGLDEEHLMSTRLFDAILPDATKELRAFVQQSLVSCYLHQSEVVIILEQLWNCINELAASCEDALLKEDVSSQQEIYAADQNADRIQLKRLLRDALRRDFNPDQLSESDQRLLLSALRLELKASSLSPDTAQIYQQYIEQFELTTVHNNVSHDALEGVFEDFTGKIVRLSNAPLAWGAIATVWKGDLFGTAVSIHCSREGFSPRNDDLDRLRKSFRWCHFKHPNILPLLGIHRDFARTGIALVSPWMTNGTVIEYIRKNPEADRLKLITEIACGLDYLHSLNPPYIHGVLTGAGALVDDNGKAIVGGFASATFQSGWNAPLPWCASELVRGDYQEANKASDMYSFAMTVLQIMTMEDPFMEIPNQNELYKALLKHARPARPARRLIHHGLDNKLWNLITRCWAVDPSKRPLISLVLKELEELRKLPDLDVPDLSFVIKLESENIRTIHASGGFGDIRRGIMKDVGRVALKMLVLKGQAQPVLRITKRFRREAWIWSSLHHPNIVPFLGTADIPGLSTCLVSPWMQNGNCMEYLRHNPKSLDLKSLIQDITRGLAYLHLNDPPIIHGDLRGANVLIDDNERALLCDFGLAVVVEDLVNMPISSALQGSGNPRWMAPELLIGEQIVSSHSDIWALGMVMLEVFTLDIPFYELKGYPQVILTLHSGGRPERPGPDATMRGLTDELWMLMTACWEQVPTNRPTADVILRYLEAGTSS